MSTNAVYYVILNRFGRKAAYTWGILFMGCAVTGSALSTNLITFCVLRFFSGLCNLGLFEIYIVWGNFFLRSKKQTITVYSMISGNKNNILKIIFNIKQALNRLVQSTEPFVVLFINFFSPLALPLWVS